MKVAQIDDYGDADALILREIDRPKVGEGQVLVEVNASSINPFDIKLRSGVMDFIDLKFPAVLGGDVAGVVVEVGLGVEKLEVGDKVYGQAGIAGGGSGAFAEFALTTADQLGLMPKNLNYNESASLALVGICAVQALYEHIELRAGQKILVTGGAGGIGTIAIQIAKYIGAYVATTDSGDGLKKVRELGADEVFDYKIDDFTNSLSEFDAVFDTAGGDNFNKALSILKEGAIGVSMIAEADKNLLSLKGLTAVTQSTHVNTERLNKLTELVEAGVVKPQVDKLYKLDQIVEGFKAKENGSIVGKIVIEINTR